MKFKPGVDVTGLHPMMQRVLNAALAIQVEYGYEPTITSGREGKHSEFSSHYSGCALDFRTKDLHASFPIDAYAEAFRHRLPAGFRVLVEGVGTPHEHIHIQYRPRVGEVREV